MSHLHDGLTESVAYLVGGRQSRQARVLLEGRPGRGERG